MHNKLCIDIKLSIKEAIKRMDEHGKKILLVVDNKKLKAVITDGNIRRYILRNGELDKSVVEIMDNSPIYLYKHEKNKAKSIMKEKSIEAIPILNAKSEVIDIIFWNDEFNETLNYYENLNMPVVIMAGGKGTRLYPYTKIIPKPLFPIGDMPIVERIINKFTEYGCKEFYMTVNYKKNMIKSYFDEIEKEYNVFYIEEDRPLGTGGSLSLLKEKINSTFFVTNCDILIDANYSDILKYHKENNNKITVITSLKNYTIPYGVINLSENGDIKETKEKPEFNFLVNTGMYILEPETLDDIPKDEFFHITYLIENYIKEGKRVGTYPVTENSWLDMGEFKEMENMINKLNL